MSGQSQTIWGMISSGGFTMYPLMICSLLVWVVIIERGLSYRKLVQNLKDFHLQSINLMLRQDWEGLRRFCAEHPALPTSRLTLTALDRLFAKDGRLVQNWLEAVERQRLLVNQELRRNLWILGTIASATPFIGLFGTVVGILRSFHQISVTGSGGFAVVAAGISEALIATAAGIIVAVIAVIGYNSFQTFWSKLVLTVKIQTEEMVEMLGTIRS
jgi:biopolymer transport protein ExbB